ncbi:MAG: TRAP transporter large permease [Pararhodobacter sp.]|nr:TRAP transporter large permease [Pararhodobacter sp.]
MIQLVLAFLILLVVGVPIAFALGVAGLIGIYVEGFALDNAVRRMFGGIDKFILLAAPFYILAGEIMNRGGITDRLIKLTIVLVGRIKGGTAYANVMSSIVFAGISGTAIADTAALGKVFIHGMEKEGYRKEFAAAVTVASALIGPIIPPSVIMLIYAAVANISVIQLFIAGVLPGIILAFACALVIAWKGRSENFPISQIKVARREVPGLARDGILVVSIPLFIVIGTLSGAFTASEAGGVAVIYAIFLGLFVFRNLDVRGLVDAFINSARMTASLFLIIACASIASYVLVISGTSGKLIAMGSMFQGSPETFMLSVIVFVILIGFFIESGVLVLVFAPLLIPIANSLGINPYHFAMVFLLAGNLSLITPPVGVVLFVACRIGNIKVGTLFREVLPFFLAELAVVFLIAYFPGISLWLIRLVGLQ